MRNQHIEAAHVIVLDNSVLAAVIGSEPKFSGTQELNETKEAKALLVQVVGDFVRCLGAAHTRTLDAKLSLAILLQNQDGTAAANALYTEVVCGYTAALGARDARTVRAKLNLANLLRAGLQNSEWKSFPGKYNLH